MQPLARWLGVNFETGFERIVAVDQREMRLPPLEQPREQLTEMSVDLFEGGAEPFATLAVEAADRTAQPRDRFGQFGLLAGVGAVLLLQPFELLGGDEIDRTDPLAAGHKLVHLLAFGGGMLHILFGEFEALGEQRRRALEALAGYARHFAAACLFAFGAGDQRRAAFARLCEVFGNVGEFAFGGGDHLLCSVLGFLGGGKLGGQPFAHHIALFDLGHQRGGLGCDHRALFLDFLEPSPGFGGALGRFG